jgi:DNA-directed RNA polymerase specialized sigma24 family protein
VAAGMGRTASQLNRVAAGMGRTASQLNRVAVGMGRRACGMNAFIGAGTSVVPRSILVIQPATRFVPAATRPIARVARFLPMATPPIPTAARRIRPMIRPKSPAVRPNAYLVPLISSTRGLLERLTQTERLSAMSRGPSDRPPHVAWLVLPVVTSAIESTLRRRGVRGADLEDHRQAVLERAYLAAPPASCDECVALVRKIAREMAIDTDRKARRRSRVDVGLCEDPDERVPADAADATDVVDARRQLAFLQSEIASGNITDRQVAILAKAVDEIPQAEIAAQMQLAHSTVRNELSAARRAARMSWAAFSAAAVVGVFAFLLSRNEPPKAGSAPPYHPDESGTPPEQTTEEMLQIVRRKALDECDKQEWAACLEDLDVARDVDPAGDNDEKLQRARAMATQHVAPVPSASASKPPRP